MEVYIHMHIFFFMGKEEYLICYFSKFQIKIQKIVSCLFRKCFKVGSQYLGQDGSLREGMPPLEKSVSF